MNITEAREIAKSITRKELAQLLNAAEQGTTDLDSAGTHNTAITKGEALSALRSLALKERGRPDLVHGGKVNALMEFGEFYS